MPTAAGAGTRWPLTWTTAALSVVPRVKAAMQAQKRQKHFALGMWEFAGGQVASALIRQPGLQRPASPAAVPSRRTPAGAREATASEPGSAVVNQFRIWLARHCRLTFWLALSSEITRIAEARAKGSPRGSVFFALLTRSKTSFTDRSSKRLVAGKSGAAA